MTEFSVPRFRSSEDFDAFVLARARARAMGVSEVPLSQIVTNNPKAWAVGDDAIARGDGGFFRVVGVSVDTVSGREVSGWTQPMIRETSGPGYVGLVRNHVGYLLVRMKAEPGNVGIDVDGVNSRVLVSPPIQFSDANYRQHLAQEPDDRGVRSSPVPLASWALDDREGVSLWWERMSPEDGGRFLDKRNGYVLLDVLVEAEALLDADIAVLTKDDVRADFAWVHPDLAKRYRVDGKVNGHLRSAMAMLS